MELHESDLHFSIHVEIDKPDVQVENVLNRFSPPEAKLESISVTLEGLNIPSWADLPQFTADDIPEILHETTLRPHNCSLFKFFHDLFATEPMERQKPEKLWFGGIDTHHVFYEGGFPPNINWGS